MTDRHEALKILNAEQWAANEDAAAHEESGHSDRLEDAQYKRGVADALDLLIKLDAEQRSLIIRSLSILRGYRHYPASYDRTVMIDDLSSYLLNTHTVE